MQGFLGLVILTFGASQFLTSSCQRLSTRRAICLDLEALRGITWKRSEILASFMAPLCVLHLGLRFLLSHICSLHRSTSLTLLIREAGNENKPSTFWHLYYFFLINFFVFTNSSFWFVSSFSGYSKITRVSQRAPPPFCSVISQLIRCIFYFFV